MRSFLLGAEREGAFNIPFKVERGGGVPTARGYVQDGLVALWDGKENAGWGVHDATATDWVDLTGGGRNWANIVTGSNSWGADHLSVYQNTRRNQTWTIGTAVNTIEVCGWSEASDSFLLFSLGGTDEDSNKLFSILPTNNRGFQFLSRSPSMFKPHNADWTASATWGDAANPDHTYYNGEEMPHTAGSTSWGSMSVAAFTPNASYSFRGKVRSIRVYDRALTAAEVAANYAVDKARFNIS